MQTMIRGKLSTNCLGASGHAGIKQAVVPFVPLHKRSVWQGVSITRYTRRKSKAPAALLQSLQNLTAWKKVHSCSVCFSGLSICALQDLPQASAPKQDRRRMSAAREELMQMVEEGSSDLSRARQLVDTLIAEQVPFDESLLGGGPWRASTLLGPACNSVWCFKESGTDVSFHAGSLFQRTSAVAGMDSPRGGAVLTAARPQQ